jgi:multidrug efflux pump subunit AcrB
MNLHRWFIANPVVLMVIIALVLLFGGLSLSWLPGKN